MTENEFAEFIEAICKRPKMYTPTGSFYEVVSFLEGFGAGANVGDKPHHSVFTPFLNWIMEKYSIKEISFHWENFQKMYLSESEALKNLPILYEEFSKSF